jgi:hypothetical protein
MVFASLVSPQLPYHFPFLINLIAEAALILMLSPCSHFELRTILILILGKVSLLFSRYLGPFIRPSEPVLYLDTDKVRGSIISLI